MARQGSQVWAGKSGQYTYEAYSLPQAFREVPGNYIFCKENADGTSWIPIYIGESSDLHARLDVGTHHRADCIRRQGATHIHSHRNDLQRDRLAEEADLLGRFSPACNG